MGELLYTHRGFSLAGAASAMPAAPAMCPAAGYRASGTHTIPLGCKTDAPFHILWDILRCWVQDHPVKGADPESAGVPACLTLRAALYLGCPTLGWTVSSLSTRFQLWVCLRLLSAAGRLMAKQPESRPIFRACLRSCSGHSADQAA